MKQHLFVKIGQLTVANLANRLAKAGPMGEVIASPKAPTLVGLAYDWRLDLVRSGVPAARRFGSNFTPE